MSLSWVALALLSLLTVGWVLLYAGRAVIAFTVPRLEDLTRLAPARWPTLSVVVPACDEAGTIESGLRSLLRQTYPGLQVVAVDDRSTDGTGAILERLAEEDPRLQVIHITELPAGWLGKVHALARGLEGASGELVLFADADTCYGEGALQRAVALLEQERLDHLTLLPRLVETGPLQGALMAAFFDGYIERTRGRQGVLLPARGALFGFGSFNLVRRAAFVRTPGFPWLRMDIADDLALGLLMREHGRCGFATAARDLAVVFYGSLGACLRGWDKNVFGILCRFSFARLAVLLGLTLLAGPAPLLLLAQPVSWLRWLAAAALVAVVASAVAGRVRFGRSLLAGLLAPLSFPFMSFALLRGGLLAALRGGILWRGTFYATAALKAGQRAWFP